jgi:DNA repair protein RadA/Sms
MLLAVLEKRTGVHTGQVDVFVNVAGGFRIEEPAADLGMAASIVSSLRDRPVISDAVAIGEIGLGGEIRAVSHMEKRVAEAAKMGFTSVVLPATNRRRMRQTDGMQLLEVETVEDAMRTLVG